jgi:hypothetical protein
MSQTAAHLVMSPLEFLQRRSRDRPSPARTHQLGLAAQAGVRYRYAALPALRRRGAQDHRCHPGAPGDRADPCSPGLGPSAAAQGSGARGGAALRCLSRSALCGLGREPFQAHSWGVLWRLKILCQAITPARTARAAHVLAPTKALQRYSNTQFCLFTIKSIRMKGLHRIGSVEVLPGNLVSALNLGGWSTEHPMCACRKWSKGRMDLWLFELSEA